MANQILVFCLLALAITGSLARFSDIRKKYSDIQRNQQILKNLKDVVEDPASQFHHSAYRRLAYLVDTYGPRLWGSQSLELAIQDLANQIKEDGIDVRLEPVRNFTKWVRGQESLTLFEPRPFPQKLKMIGLGRSVGGNVTADAVVVTSFDDLQAKAHLVPGKIVIYAVPWVNYETTVAYRGSGAIEAAKLGAVAALVRSITPFSIESPHTGSMSYAANVTQIPAAAIAVEDAEMFLRMFERGQRIRLNLYMESWNVPNANSFNVVAELRGSVYPEKILVLGGHTDSWDVGSQTGANDDGGGFVTCYEALRLIAKSGLTPKRTIRFIAWSGEEYGGSLSGASQYANDHKDEMDNHIVAFESDLGSRTPVAWGFSGGQNGLNYFQDLVSTYFKPIYNITEVLDGEGEMVDSGYIGSYGVPMVRNIGQDTPSNDYYFTFHHSAGDSMSVMDPDQMDENVVGIASLFYLLADADVALPRD
ncbi:plasma glutamate carboxypeptidase (macronuclear) [Tetrahymena thermophila SB210]|uniref:Carboxypeptidase Q n=1 Tax=Tetrahymena thermophila (strain SB210) TaxID=312017 RepID=Q232E1_TETTS|nr:plasma glutamate carboxypeptidase [Tetrahymena thermophila SB210]EAR91471.1 plasma glutamate carboxypeptidase [Tetrahymena thermophila SB210]|eukprot:XP_001011716.1 plasma glutamate carboxypeptidase [Tetrahymena thermophila SB210]